MDRSMRDNINKAFPKNLFSFTFTAIIFFYFFATASAGEATLLPVERELFPRTILITAITSILISFYILWAINRDIETAFIRKENYFAWRLCLKKENDTRKSPSEQQYQEDRIQRERAFFCGLWTTIFALSIIGIAVIGSPVLIFGWGKGILIYSLILFMLILFFTVIFTVTMVGYIHPLALGLLSGVGTFLIFLSWLFSIHNINIGIIEIPIYMPASSFIGVLAYMFVSLFFDPSKLDPKEDYERTRRFLARFLAAIALGIAVYVVLQPFSPEEATKYTKYGFAFFGFASGFYISSIVHFLRRKIMTLIDEEGFRDDERERIIKDMGNHPEKYALLSEDEIGRICNEINFDKEEFKKRLDFVRFIGSKAFKTLAGEGIKSFEDIVHVSEDKIKEIIKKEKIKGDEKEWLKLLAYLKILGIEKARNLFKKGITHREFRNLADEKITELCTELKMDGAKLIAERKGFEEKCKEIDGKTAGGS